MIVLCISFIEAYQVTTFVWTLKFEAFVSDFCTIGLLNFDSSNQTLLVSTHGHITLSKLNYNLH